MRERNTRLLHLFVCEPAYNPKVSLWAGCKTKGPGRSRADRGLKFGECKGVFFAPNNRNLNVFYEAFATVFVAFARRFGRSIKKYLRTNTP
jgi:hypothetical protein